MTSRYTYGGLEIKKEKVNKFDTFLEMLKDKESVLDLITDGSLKGFIFSLKVEDGKSNYTEDGKDVNNFALKIVIISENEDPLGNGKYTETEKNFIAEASMQHEIWNNSHLNSQGEVAPSVGNLVILKNQQYIIKLLKEFYYYSNTTQKAKDSLNFIYRCFSQRSQHPEYKLGILLMKNYKETEPFKNYVLKYKNDFKKQKQKYLNIKQNILIKVLRLALLGYIHLDLHPGNSLASDNGFCVIIDYGRAVSIKNGTMDNYIEYIAKEMSQITKKTTDEVIKEMYYKPYNGNSMYFQLQESFKNLFYTLKFIKQHMQITNKIMEEFYKSIRTIDYITNMYLYRKNSAQMDDLLNYDYVITKDVLYNFNNKKFNIDTKDDYKLQKSIFDTNIFIFNKKQHDQQQQQPQPEPRVSQQHTRQQRLFPIVEGKEQQPQPAPRVSQQHTRKRQRLPIVEGKEEENQKKQEADLSPTDLSIRFGVGEWKKIDDVLAYYRQQQPSQQLSQQQQMIQDLESINHQKRSYQQQQEAKEMQAQRISPIVEKEKQAEVDEDDEEELAARREWQEELQQQRQLIQQQYQQRPLTGQQRYEHFTQQLQLDKYYNQLWQQYKQRKQQQQQTQIINNNNNDDCKNGFCQRITDGVKSGLKSMFHLGVGGKSKLHKKGKMTLRIKRRKNILKYGKKLKLKTRKSK